MHAGVFAGTNEPLEITDVERPEPAGTVIETGEEVEHVSEGGPRSGRPMAYRQPIWPLSGVGT